MFQFMHHTVVWSHHSQLLDGYPCLRRNMGVITALAIGLHNFPEGMATFVSTLSDPNFGTPFLNIISHLAFLCLLIPLLLLHLFISYYCPYPLLLKSSSYQGVAMTIAIAMHNIPEGICVAMPLYYATGNRLPYSSEKYPLTER